MEYQLKALISTILLLYSNFAFSEKLRTAWVHFPPFVVHDGSGNVTGHLVEKTRKILSDAKIESQHIVLPMQRLITMASNHEVDLVISHPKVLPNGFIFGKYTFQEFNLKVLSRKAFKKSFDEIAKHSHIGLIRGHFHFGFDKKIPKTNQVTVRNYETALLMMSKGRIDHMLAFHGRYQETLKKLIKEKRILDKRMTQFSTKPLINQHTTIGVRASLPNAKKVLEKLNSSFVKLYGPAKILPKTD